MSTQAFSLNFLANSLAEKNIDNALIALGLIFASQLSGSVSRYSQGLIDNFMQYGSDQAKLDFDGLEAMLIKMVNEDPFLAQKFEPIKLKSFLQKIENEYHDLYNIMFNNLLPNIFSVFGSVLSATTLLKGSIATIIPPITSIVLNYIAQEKRNQILIPLRSKLISVSTNTETLLQSLISEISKRLNIRDAEKTIHEVMPEILKIKNKILVVEETFVLLRQISISTALYAGLSIVGIKLDNAVLKALFGGELSNTLGMAMLQTQTSLEAANLISGVKGLNLTQELIYNIFIGRLSKPEIKGFEINNTNISFKDFSLFVDHPEKKQSKDFKPGSIICINGANGTGKSTLLDLFSTQTSKKPFLGEIAIGDIPLNLLNTNQYRELMISMPQNIQVFNGSIALNISGKNNPNSQLLDIFIDSPLAQNIGYKIFNSHWSNWTKNEQQNWWKENLDKVLIGQVFKVSNRAGEEKDVKIDSLSGGEQKILGMLRVWNKLIDSDNKANIVTLDEPIANLSFTSSGDYLDTQSSIYRWMQNQILKILQKYPKTTVFFIDHSQSYDSLYNQIVQSSELSGRLHVFEM